MASCKDIKESCYYTEEFRFNKMIEGKEDKFNWKRLAQDEIIPNSLLSKYLKEGRLTIYDLHHWHESMEDIILEFKDQLDFEREKTYNMQKGWLYNYPEFYNKMDQDFINNASIDKTSYKNIKILFDKGFIKLQDIVYGMNNDRLNDKKEIIQWLTHIKPIILENYNKVLTLIVNENINFSTHVMFEIYSIFKTNISHQKCLVDGHLNGETVLEFMNRKLLDKIVEDSYFKNSIDYFPSNMWKHLTEKIIDDRFDKMFKRLSFYQIFDILELRAYKKKFVKRCILKVKDL